MSDTIEQRLDRLESLLRAIVENLNPLMTVDEVRRMLGFAGKNAAWRWLKANGIKRVGKGYRRVEVVAKATKGNP